MPVTSKRPCITTFYPCRWSFLQSLPPDEESRAWDAYRSLRHKNLSVTEDTDKFRECVMKISNPLPSSVQLKDYIYGLNDRIKMEVRAKYVTTLCESIAVALNYEDARGRPSGFVQAGPQHEYPRKGGFQRRWTLKSNVLQPSGQTKQVKAIERLVKTSTIVWVKRKVTPMAARAWSKSLLNPEQREKVRKEGLCFGCLQQH